MKKMTDYVEREIEITSEMLRAGAQYISDIFECPMVSAEGYARDVFKAMISHAPPFDRETPNRCSPASLETVLERMDLIHSEFERRKQQGLPHPSLREIDQMFDRT